MTLCLHVVSNGEWSVVVWEVEDVQGDLCWGLGHPWAVLWDSWSSRKHCLHEAGEVVYPLSFGRWQYLTPNSLQQLLGLVSADPRDLMFEWCAWSLRKAHTGTPQLVHHDDGTHNSSLYVANILKFCFSERDCFPFSCMPSWTAVPGWLPSVVDSLAGCTLP